MRLSKAMTASVPAAHTKKTRLLELQPEPGQQHCWSGSNMSSAVLIDPLEALVLVVENVKIVESSVDVKVELQPETAAQLNALSGNAPEQFFNALQRRQKEPPKSAATKSRAVAAPTKKKDNASWLSAEDIDMHQKGREVIKRFMTKLPALYTENGVELLDKNGMVTFKVQGGTSKQLHWDEVILRAPAAFHAAFAEGGKGKFGANVLQVLKDMKAEAGRPYHVFRVPCGLVV